MTASPPEPASLLEPLDLATRALEGLTWSARVIDTAYGRVLDEREPDLVLPTASVGKVLLLIALAEHFADGRLDPADRVAPVEEDWVEDSGLLQFMACRELPLVDLARWRG